MLINTLTSSERNTDLIKSTLQAAFGVPSADSCEQLSGGFSSPGVYKILVKDTPYVLRISKAEYSLADKQRELNALQKSAERGISPRVIYKNIEAGTTIIEWVANQKIDHEAFLQDNNLKTLATQIKRLHDGPKFEGSFSPFQAIRDKATLLKGEKPQLIIEALSLLENLDKKLQTRLISLPCHNDLNPNNILYSDGELFFIDWELASQGDPFFDVSTILIFYPMNNHQKSLFLSTYFGHAPQEIELEKLNDMQCVTLLYYGFCLLITSQEKGQEFLDAGTIAALPRLKKHYINKTNNLLKTPRDLQEFGLVMLKEALLLKIT